MAFKLTLEFYSLGEVELAAAAVRKAFEKAGIDNEVTTLPTLGGPTPEKSAAAPAAASGQGTAKAGAAHGKTAAAPTPAAAPAEAERQVSTAAPAPAPASGSGSATSAAKDAANSPSDPVTYADLQKAVMVLYTKDKKAPAALVQEKMGVDHFNKLKPEQYGEALGHVNAKIRELSK